MVCDVAATFQELLQDHDLVLHLGQHVGLEQIRVPLERLLGRVEQRLGLVSQLGQLLAQGVAVWNLPASPTSRSISSGDRPLVGVTRTFCTRPVPEVLGLDADDAVRVDAERHLDLRHAARRGRNAGELEAREAAVVGGHLALALEHVDRHEVLVVDAGR